MKADTKISYLRHLPLWEQVTATPSTKTSSLSSSKRLLSRASLRVVFNQLCEDQHSFLSALKVVVLSSKHRNEENHHLEMIFHHLLCLEQRMKIFIKAKKFSSSPGQGWLKWLRELKTKMTSVIASHTYHHLIVRSFQETKCFPFSFTYHWRYEKCLRRICFGFQWSIFFTLYWRFVSVSTRHGQNRKCNCFTAVSKPNLRKE